MKLPTEFPRIDVPAETLSRWQGIVDIIAELIEVPAALIMRLVESDIEVLIASRSEGNPYHPGDHEHFLGSGLYCETAIRSNQPLLVPNALEDTDWRDNPDIKLNMISYLGMPLLFPDGTAFGTICVLDSKTNHYKTSYVSLLANFRDVIQSQLELIYMNRQLGEENRKLSDYLQEIRILRGIVPICSYCKNIRDASGQWHGLEHYMTAHTHAEFSHGICDACLNARYPESAD